MKSVSMPLICFYVTYFLNLLIIMEMQILAWHCEMKKTNLLCGQVAIIVVGCCLLFSKN